MVRDQHTDLPFDTAGINTYTYDSNLHGWEIDEQQAQLAEHIAKSVESCGGQNPLWRQFGLTITAQKPADTGSPIEAKVDLLTMQMIELQESIAIERRMSERHLVEFGRSLVDQQMNDPNRTAPSVLFSAAVERVARDIPTLISVDVTSPRSAVVEIERDTPKVFLQRILKLAANHEVAVDFVYSDDGDVEHHEGAKTRGGTFVPPSARQVARRVRTSDERAKSSPQYGTAVDERPTTGRE